MEKYVKTLRYLNSDVHIVEQEDEKISLLQSNKKYPLSKFYSNEGEVIAIINCSYLSSSYVNGRNQGDEKNDTYSDSENGKWADIVFFKDGTYKSGKFNSWDYKENVSAGFSPCVLQNESGLYYSELLNNYSTKLTTVDPQTAIAVTSEDKIIFIKVDGRISNSKGLTGQQVFDMIDKLYPNNKLKALLDGGGSTELIVNNKIIGNLSDGSERPMFNGLALIKVPETQKAMFPLKLGAVTQPMNGEYSHKGLKAIDFGWLLSDPAGDYNLYAPFDGTIMFADDVSKGASLAFQSDYPVLYADGTIDYMTVITAHDNNRPSVGSKFKQGEKYSKMGTAGGVGKHAHIEVQKGKYKPYTSISQQLYGNVYVYPNTIEPYKGLFMDSSINIRKSDDPYADKWVYLGQVLPQEEDKNKNQVLVDIDGLRVRDLPSTENGKYLYTCQKGYYEVYEIQNGNDYTWYKINDGMWIAGVEGVTYFPKENENCEENIKELEEEINKLEEKIDELNSENNILNEKLKLYLEKFKYINEYSKNITDLSNIEEE